MKKYCGKCGTRLDESTGYCPKCDTAKIRKRLRRSRIRGVILKCLVLILFFVCISAGMMVALTYFNIVEVPFISAIPENTGKNQESTAVSEQITGRTYIPNEENIVYNTKSKASGYVNNMILVFAYKDVSLNRISEIAELLGGKIVGGISGIYQYQIQVAPGSREELEALCNKAKEFEEIKDAVIDEVFQMEKNEMEIPNDPWGEEGNEDWNEDEPKGNNWWVEAVRVPSAWKYRDSFSEIKVGVVDTGFDTSHEDLNITVLNGFMNSAEHHGTHVAGIIGATNNNGKGITGILEQVNLYGIDCYANLKNEEYPTVSSLMNGIVLCISNGCKVVNMSTCLKPGKIEETKVNAEATADYAIAYLIKLLDVQTKDFIIVQSAGNGDEKDKGWDSQQYAGYFASVTEERVRKILNKMKEAGIKFEHDISIQDVLDSFMIVGAVDKKRKHGTWQLAEFSNYGDAITVCAPGFDIYSTTVMGSAKGKNYVNASGTSMAAPIVAGVTAMVWSVDQRMSAGEVKRIVQETADINVLSRRKEDKGTYHMVNAVKAVKKALKDTSKDSHDSQKEQTEQPDIPIDAAEYGDHYYYIYNLDTVTTWEDAKKYCEAQGGYIATITSKEEDEFIYNYLRSKFDYKNAYFGFTDKDEEGNWVWSNGEKVSYVNWHTGEPNSENSNEDYCMYFYQFEDGSWNDGDFGGLTVNGDRAFICEWGPYKKQTEKEDRQIEVTKSLQTYESFLENPKSCDVDWKGSREVSTLEESRFGLIYLDNDKIPELVIYDIPGWGHAGGYGAVFEVDNNQVVCIGILEDEYGFYEKTGVYYTMFSQQGCEDYMYMRKKEDGVQTVLYKSVDDFYETGKPTYIYGVPDNEPIESDEMLKYTEIDRETFNRELKKLVGNKKAKKPKMYTNTASNRKAVLDRK